MIVIIYNTTTKFSIVIGKIVLISILLVTVKSLLQLWLF